jgi:DNA-binding GntR family transcriptional regulator
MHRIERPKSLTELVCQSLRQEIVSGDLAPGEALSEVRIARRLAVSRTPVREAFARLELEGLVRTEPQRGTFVFDLGPKELADICAVRVCLETAALRFAMEHDRAGLTRDLARITTAMRRARKAGDDRRYLALDTEFHQQFFDHADNAFLDDAYQTIAAKMAALRNRLGNHPDHMAKSFDEHCRLAELIGASEEEPAVDLLTRHIGRKEGSYWNI